MMRVGGAWSSTEGVSHLGSFGKGWSLGNFFEHSMGVVMIVRKLGLSALCSAHNVSNTALGEGGG